MQSFGGAGELVPFHLVDSAMRANAEVVGPTSNELNIVVAETTLNVTLAPTPL